MIFLSIIVAYVAVCILWSVIFKSTLYIRFVSVIASAVLAFVATIVFKSVADADTLTEVITLMKNVGLPVDILIENSYIYGDVLVKFLASLVAPVIFIALFITFDILFFLIRVVIFVFKAIIFKPTNKPGIAKRVAFGAVQGLVTVFCFLLPVTIYIGIVSDISDEIPELTSSQENVRIITTAAEKANNSLVLKSYRTLGGNLACNALTSIKVTTSNNTVLKTTVNKEIGAMTEFYVDITKLGKTPVANYGDAEINALSEIGLTVKDSEVITEIACHILHEATDAWINNETFYGISKPELDPKLDPLVNALIELLNASSENSENFKEDLTTLTEVIEHLYKTGVLTAVSSGTDELIATLQKDGVMSELISIVNSNSRTKKIIPVVTNLGMTLVADSLGIPNIDDEAYNDFVSAIKDDFALNSGKTKEERIESMSDTINRTLSDNGYEQLGDFELNIISESIITYFDNGGVLPDNLTEEDIAAFLGLVCGN